MNNKDRLIKGFFSYVRQNDVHDGGNLSQLRKSLEIEVWAQTAEDIKLFQDQDDIFWGQKWKERIIRALNASRFLIAIITPSYLKSEPCRFEFEHFLVREKELGGERILPLMYIETPELINNSDSVAIEICRRQWFDWTALRFSAIDSAKVKRQLEVFAKQIRNLIAEETVIDVHRRSISIPNSVIVKNQWEENWHPPFDGEKGKIAIPSLYVPLSDKVEDRPSLQITVLVRQQNDPERDRRQIKTLYGTLVSYHGRDKFSFQIFEGGKGHLIDFPNDTTRVCPELLERLKKLVGDESWRVEEITVQ